LPYNKKLSASAPKKTNNKKYLFMFLTRKLYLK